LGRDRELPPPLEMMCLNALWEIQEGNVEDVRRVVSLSRPLAYTTVLTLLDRLARRGAVSRRKEGRGFRYQPTVARDKLRRMALRQFLEYHFDGSEAKLRFFLEQPVEDHVEELLAITEQGDSGEISIGQLKMGSPPMAFALAIPEQQPEE
jgi:BlaI family penicillinase repressor